MAYVSTLHLQNGDLIRHQDGLASVDCVRHYRESGRIVSRFTAKTDDGNSVPLRGSADDRWFRVEKAYRPRYELYIDGLFTGDASDSVDDLACRAATHPEASQKPTKAVDRTSGFTVCEYIKSGK